MLGEVGPLTMGWSTLPIDARVSIPVNRLIESTLVNLEATLDEYFVAFGLDAGSGHLTR